MATYLTHSTDIKINAPSGVTEGDLVSIGTNGVVTATDGARVYGMARSTAAAGASTVVQTQGQVKVQLAASYNPDMGDPVVAAGSNTVDAGTTGDPVCGYIVHSDPASAGIATMLLAGPASGHAAA